MTKKTLLLIVLLLAALAGAYYIVSRPEKISTLNDAEINFSVKDTAAVTKVFISTKNGQNNLLKRQENNTWTVNDKYEVNQVSINLLLETIHRMQVKRPVSKQARNTVIRTLATQGTKVEIYTKEGLLKTFYVGGNSTDEKGSHFLMDGFENPYVLHIRGFDGYLSSRFTFSEKDWRSKIIFRSIPPTIQEISVVYNDTPSASFTIQQKGNSFVLKDAENADTAAVKSYVAQFRNLHSEMIIENAPQRFLDSLSLITPRAIVSLKDANPEKSQKLVVYPNPNDPVRMVARYGQNGETLSTIQQQMFGKILIRKNQLLRNPKTKR